MLERRFGTAVALVVLLMGLAFDVLGWAGVPTTPYEWAWQNGLIGGALLVLVILWLDELDAAARRLVAVVVRRQ